MGVTPLMLWLACLMVVRNQRILAAWDARQEARARKRRRKTLTAGSPGPP